jgi:tetratricopeptide (TPR) repeat protein
MTRGRKQTLLLAFFGVLFCAGLLCRETRQNRLDHALLAAIERGDSGAVVSLLAQGADPNTHRMPNVPISFWRMLLDRLRGRPLPEGPSALQIALRKDLQYDMPRHQVESRAIIEALMDHGGQAPATPEKAAPSLDWAERYLGTMPDRLARLSEGLARDEDLSWECEDAEDAFKSILLKYGASARAYAGLAECRLRLGKYAAADQAFRLALLWPPADSRARAGLLRADTLWRVYLAVRSLLPDSYKVIYLRPYPVVPGNCLWAVLYGKGEEEDRQCKSVHLALYAKSGRTYRAVWRSGVLKDTYHQFEQDYYFYGVQMFVCRLIGEDAPQIIVHEVSPGGSWEPSHIDVFTWRQGRLVNILQVGGSMPLWVEDLKRDGRYEIGNYYEIGVSMSHAEQPRWSDIYAYRNGRYVLANRDFPEAFTHWLTDLRDTLSRHPDDYAIWQHLGETYAITGHPDRALAAYRRAERSCGSLLKRETDHDLRVELKEMRRQMRQRVQALERGTPGRE